MRRLLLTSGRESVVPMRHPPRPRRPRAPAILCTALQSFTLLWPSLPCLYAHALPYTLYSTPALPYPYPYPSNYGLLELAFVVGLPLIEPLLLRCIDRVLLVYVLFLGALTLGSLALKSGTCLHQCLALILGAQIAVLCHIPFNSSGRRFTKFLTNVREKTIH